MVTLKEMPVSIKIPIYFVYAIMAYLLVTAVAVAIKIGFGG
jgi:hypothetical protein